MKYKIKKLLNASIQTCGVHINGIEFFSSFTKRRLTKFNGVKKNFYLHLKECEWRWNKSYSQIDFVRELLNEMDITEAGIYLRDCGISLSWRRAAINLARR